MGSKLPSGTAFWLVPKFCLTRRYDLFPHSVKKYISALPLFVSGGIRQKNAFNSYESLTVRCGKKIENDSWIMSFSIFPSFNLCFSIKDTTKKYFIHKQEAMKC